MQMQVALQQRQHAIKLLQQHMQPRATMPATAAAHCSDSPSPSCAPGLAILQYLQYFNTCNTSILAMKGRVKMAVYNSFVMRHDSCGMTHATPGPAQPLAQLLGRMDVVGPQLPPLTAATSRLGREGNSCGEHCPNAALFCVITACNLHQSSAAPRYVEVTSLPPHTAGALPAHTGAGYTHGPQPALLCHYSHPATPSGKERLAGEARCTQ
jgi:hypothetical protein